MPHPIPHIESGQVTHGIGPHGHPEALERVIDLGWRGPFEQHQLILATIGVQHAIADKAKAVADNDAELADVPYH